MSIAAPPLILMGRIYDHNTHSWVAKDKSQIPAELMASVACLADVFYLIDVGERKPHEH